MLISVPVAFAPRVVEAIFMSPEWLGILAPWVSLAMFSGLAASIYFMAVREDEPPLTHDPTGGVKREHR